SCGWFSGSCGGCWENCPPPSQWGLPAGGLGLPPPPAGASARRAASSARDAACSARVATFSSLAQPTASTLAIIRAATPEHTDLNVINLTSLHYPARRGWLFRPALLAQNPRPRKDSGVAAPPVSGSRAVPGRHSGG